MHCWAKVLPNFVSPYFVELSVSVFWYVKFLRKMEATLTQPLAMLQSLNDTSASGTGICWVPGLHKGGRAEMGWDRPIWLMTADDYKCLYPTLSSMMSRSAAWHWARWGCLCHRNGHTLYIYFLSLTSRSTCVQAQWWLIVIITLTGSRFSKEGNLCAYLRGSFCIRFI